MNKLLKNKEAELKSILKDMESVIIAYSGGVDSALLAFMANKSLGNKALAITALSPSLASYECDEAVNFAKEYSIQHMIIHTNEMDNPSYVENSLNRCYFCKDELYKKLHVVAKMKNYKWVASGTNVDDLGDFRPGIQAGKEHLIRNPLVEAKFTKKDIRELSKIYHLPTSEKPAQPSLASRIPYGNSVTIDSLKKISRSEKYLKELGFRQLRVRHLDDIARIEISDQDISLIVREDIRNKIIDKFKEIGYQYITLNLEGFRSGSLNVKTS